MHVLANFCYANLNANNSQRERNAVWHCYCYREQLYLLFCENCEQYCCISNYTSAKRRTSAASWEHPLQSDSFKMGNRFCPLVFGTAKMKP